MSDKKPLRTWEKLTVSPEETYLLAEQLGRVLIPGDVVALIGELGSGKTIFCQGLARGLEVPESFYITSPTFTIVNQYPGRIPFYHIDLYRVSGVAEVSELGLEEVIYGQGVVAIEWAERLDEHLPEGRLEIHLSFAGEFSRNLAFQACGETSERRLLLLVEEFRNCELGN
jgi:tRNA threonylcarbamoyladenosine biosynthesis protein TsaE